MLVINVINNKQLVLFDNATGNDPNTATNYAGFGTQSGGSLRIKYQQQLQLIDFSVEVLNFFL